MFSLPTVCASMGLKDIAKIEMDIIEAHRILYCEGLVRWTSGNASVRNGDFMSIKPSGVSCRDVAVTSQVKLADGRYDLALKPSTDFESHRYIYNHLPEIGAVIHTHSTFATAFAVAGHPIPCCMTEIADEFGGDIPISSYCGIGDDSIGKEVVRLYESTKCPAIIIKQHGVFTVGKTIDAAVRSAILVEDCAKTMFFAQRIGACARIEEVEIKKHNKRYQTDYGQAAQ